MKRALRDLATVAAALAVFGASRLTFNLFGLQLVGAEAVGRANLALAWGLLLSLPVSAGFATALSRHAAPLVPPARRRLLGLLTSEGMFATLVAAASFALVHAAGMLVRTDRAVVLAAILWGLQYGAYALLRAYLFAGDRAATALRLELAGAAAFAGALVLVAWRPHWFWLPFTVYWLPAVLWLARELGRSQKATGLPPIGAVRRYALLALAGSAAGIGVMQLTTVRIAAEDGLVAAGLWSTLLSALSPLLLAPRTLNSTLLPRLSRRAGSDPQGFATLADRHQRLASLVALAVVAPPLLLARPAVEVLLGAEAAPAWSGVWAIACVAVWAVIRGEPLLTAAGAAGRIGAAAIAAWSSVPLCAAIWLAASREAFGPPGIAAGWAAYALAVPLVAASLRPRYRARGPYPRPRAFVADLAFVGVAMAAGADGSPSWRFGAAALALAAAAHGVVRARTALHDEGLGEPSARWLAASRGVPERKSC